MTSLKTLIHVSGPKPSDAFFPEMELTPAELASVGLYERYRVHLHVRDRLCGGKPASENLLEPFLRGKGVADAQARQELIEKMKADMDTALTEQVELKSSVFLRVGGIGGPLCLMEYNLKAFLKENANQLGYLGAGGIRQPLQHSVFVKPVHVPLYKETEPVYKADGIGEKVSHTISMRGPVSGINRFEYVTSPDLYFEVWSNKHTPKKPTKEQLVNIFLQGQEGGLGASRSMSEGKVDLVYVAQVEDSSAS